MRGKAKDIVDRSPCLWIATSLSLSLSMSIYLYRSTYVMCHDYAVGTIFWKIHTHTHTHIHTHTHTFVRDEVLFWQSIYIQPHRLQALCTHICLRRTKELLHTLPPKKLEIVKVAFLPEEKKLYEEAEVCPSNYIDPFTFLSPSLSLSCIYVFLCFSVYLSICF